jgi:predicted dehydrogenase
MTTTRARCAIVGLGQGLEDLYCTLYHPRFDVRAVCDVDPAPYQWITGKAELSASGKDIATSPHHNAWVSEIRRAPEIGSVHYESDFDALLGRLDVDAVILVVPDALHVPFAVQALQAGKFVLCTKPMALTLEESLSLGRAARDHPGRYMLGFQMTYSPFAQVLLDVIGSGEIGALRQVRFDYHRAPWRPMHSHKHAPVDGAIIKEGVHWLDLIYRLGGERPWRAVSGFGAIDLLTDTVDFEDNGVLLIDYPGFRAAHTFSYFRRSRQQDDILLVGERGTVRGSFFRLHLETDEGERDIEVPGHVLPHQHHVGYYQMIDEFAGVVLDGKEPYTNWRTGLENMLTSYAAQVAVMEGRTVFRDELRERDWRVVLDQDADVAAAR